MKDERLYQIILSPRLSEKSTELAEAHRHFVFEVASDATKPEIKQAVEMLFKVEVDDVQVANVRGKMKRQGRRAGKRRNWKKAFVQLKPGHDIDFVGGQT